LPQSKRYLSGLGLTKEREEQLVDAARILVEGGATSPLVDDAAQIAARIMPSHDEGNLIVWWDAYVLRPYAELGSGGTAPLLPPSVGTRLGTIIDDWLSSDDELDGEFPVRDESVEHSPELQLLALWQAIRWRRFLGLWDDLCRELDARSLLNFVAWGQGLFAAKHDGDLLPVPLKS